MRGAFAQTRINLWMESTKSPLIAAEAQKQTLRKRAICDPSASRSISIKQTYPSAFYKET